MIDLEDKEWERRVERDALTILAYSDSGRKLKLRRIKILVDCEVKPFRGTGRFLTAAVGAPVWDLKEAQDALRSHCPIDYKKRDDNKSRPEVTLRISESEMVGILLSLEKGDFDRVDRKGSLPADVYFKNWNLGGKKIILYIKFRKDTTTSGMFIISFHEAEYPRKERQ